MARDAAGVVVAVRQGNAMALAFHPELTGDQSFHRMFVDLVRAHKTKANVCSRVKGVSIKSE